MTGKSEKLQAKLELVGEILDEAFFSPLHAHDWLAFCFGQPALLGLEEDELLDLFVRAAIAAETIHPELVEGRDPLAWLWALPEGAPVLAQVLASLRHDRPFLFHRMLYALPAVTQGQVSPGEDELMEDFLRRALEEAMELREDAASELSVVCRRALKAAGQHPEKPDPRLAPLAAKVLARPAAAECATDAELLSWMILGEGLKGVDPALAPAVMVEAWARWVGAITGAGPDLDLLTRWLPGLSLSAQELALYAPPDRKAGHVISAECPYCQAQTSLSLGETVKEISRCPHLLYVGTSDEVHLLEVLSHFDLGADFKALLASYYQAPSDLEIYATIINDLYEMLRHQGRLEARPVQCAGAGKAFYNLRAYFAGPPAGESTRH